MAFPASTTEGPRNTENWLYLSRNWRPDAGVVSTLPTNPRPAEGDRCIFKAAAGVFWELVYTGEANFPWAKIGGPALRTVLVNVAATATATPTKTAQSVKAPLKGIYRVDATSLLNQNQTAELNDMRCLAISGAGAVLSQAIFISTAQFQGSSVREQEEIELAAGTEVFSGYYSVNAKSTAYTAVRAAIDPLRVG